MEFSVVHEVVINLGVIRSISKKRRKPPDNSNYVWEDQYSSHFVTRNPSTNQNGELAVDVVLEKEAVKQSGDAWRIVIDSCLPVIHLIDTTTSTPNAIKQVQEFLGISAAFNQAVQRLSKSVSMVTKGIIKEHLILLANSMTYTGSMIGLNSDGIKALSRSSNIRGPFAEATPLTPNKCFERASEKGHFDSSSSIAASCSWGKQVSVGTGSKLDLLWATREVEKNDGINVYEFLHLVRSTKDKAADSGGLGDDVDDDLDYDNGEWYMSPEHGSERPTFEDTIELSENQVGNVCMSGNDRKWGAGATSTSSKPSAWFFWGSDTGRKGDITITPLADGGDEPAANAWGSTPKYASSNIRATWGSGAKEDNNNIEKESVSDSWGTSSKKSERGVSKGWGGGADVSPSLEPSWGQRKRKFSKYQRLFRKTTHGEQPVKGTSLQLARVGVLLTCRPYPNLHGVERKKTLLKYQRLLRKTILEVVHLPRKVKPTKNGEIVQTKKVRLVVVNGEILAAHNLLRGKLCHLLRNRLFSLDTDEYQSKKKGSIQS